MVAWTSGQFRRLQPKFDPVALAEMAKRGTVSGAFEDYPVDSWRQRFRCEPDRHVLVLPGSRPPMLLQGKGVLINICSMYGLVGPDQRLYQRDGKQTSYKPVYYSVTKAGVLGMTNYLATYYAGKNIRANALTPGGFLMVTTIFF